MKTRGRPRHPDILTPRQQDVLALLRRGLTNEEIAQQLGISVDGVKYHVSDILTRLSVPSRYEAARWQPEPLSRWHALLAPFAFMRNARWGVAGQAAGALVVVGVVAAVALFGWAVLAADNGDADSSDPLILVPGEVETGNAALDQLIDLLEAQDVDALLDRVLFRPVPCKTGDRYNEPACPAGVDDGADVPAFAAAACEGAFVTTRGEIRPRFDYAFRDSGRSSVYAVGRGAMQENGELYNVVVITPGADPSPMAPPTQWYADDDGRIVLLLFECAGYAIGAADTVEARGLGGAGFIVEPRASCKTGAASITLHVTFVRGGSGARPSILGDELDASGQATGRRVFVTVFNERPLPFVAERTPQAHLPEWRDGLAELSDLSAGMTISVQGERLENCTIDAHVISRTAGDR